MYKNKIEAKLTEVLSFKRNFSVKTEEGDFNKITAPLVLIEEHLREQIQAETSDQILEIIQKLKSNKDITDTDLMLTRLWIVGDAAAYVEMENDYQSWLDEINRLFSEIERLKVQELTLKNMYKLSGIVRDAIRVTGDIVFFKQQQERINKFENASKQLNSDNKRVLADILKQKLESDQM